MQECFKFYVERTWHLWERVTVALGCEGQSYLTLLSGKSELSLRQLHVFSFQVV